MDQFVSFLIGRSFAMVCLLFFGLPCWADVYPVRPIRLIAANSAGGGLDTVSRAISGKLSAALGQSVIVDNRAGAAGSVASEITAKSAPDGYTLLCGSLGGLAVNTELYKGLTWHPMRDFSAVISATSQSNVVAVNISTTIKTIKDLITTVKTQPGKLTYGSSGAGNGGHLATELFLAMTGGKMVHDPYKGGAPAMVDLIAGQVQVVFSSAPTAIPQLRTGKIRGLAVTTLQRSSVLPDLPTLAESGLAGYDADNWYGFVVAAKTPQKIVQQLHTEIDRALHAPDVQQKLLLQGLEVHTGTSAEFAAYMKSEHLKWGKLIRETGISAN